MDFMKGQRVFVEGDGQEICTADYTVRISSWATVVDDPDPADDYVLLSIDKAGNDRDAWVYVLKKFVRAKEP